MDDSTSTHSSRKAPPREEFPFLVAEHAFDAQSLDQLGVRDANAHCLSFAQGELAYVHSVHASGWADVTLVNNGERGWAPIDFFAQYKEGRAVPLLSAVAAFLQQPRSMRRPSNLGGQDQPEWTFSDAAINEIIAGVKRLLIRCDVVSRESPLVADVPAIAAARKALLVDLAHIVHVAKHNLYSTDERVILKLVRACYRLLERTRVLLMVLNDHQSELDRQELIYLQLQQQQQDPEEPGPSPRSSVSSRSRRSSARSSKSQRSQRSMRSMRSAQSTSTSQSSLMTLSSFSDHPGIPPTKERVHEVQQALNRYLQQFEDTTELLANPEDPQTPPAVLALTRHCMLACRELLVVLDINREQEPLKDAILDEIRKLVSAARSLVAALPPSPPQQRAAAISALSLTASHFRKLSNDACQGLFQYLQHNPHQTLPQRTYPVLWEPGDMADSENEDTQLSSELEEHEGEAAEATPKAFNQEHRLSGPPESRPPASVRTNSTRTESLRTTTSSSQLNVSKLAPAASTLSLSSARSHSITTAPSSLSLISAESNLVFRNGQLRGGTLSAIVEWLLDTEAQFETRTFLTCFRLFTTPRELLIELGSCPSIDQVRKFASLWVSSFYEQSDEGCLNSLMPYISKDLVSKRQSMEPQRQIVPLMLGPLPGSSRQTSAAGADNPEGHRPPMNSTASTASLPMRNGSLSTQFGTYSALNLAAQFRELGLGARRTSRQNSMGSLEDGLEKLPSSAISEELLTRSPPEIAAQVTLMWFQIYKKIAPRELLDQRFSSTKRKLGLAPNVTLLVQNSNYLTAFVGDTILADDLSVKQRTRVLKHWIRIANEMLALGNVNGAVTVVSTLNTTRIVRLSRVWDSLGNKTHQLLDRLMPIASPERNFAECRRVVRTLSDANSFCIPYMGVVLSDLVLIDEGNPKVLSGNNTDAEVINFDRYLKMARVIAQMQPFQLIDLDITPDTAMQAWIRAQAARSHLRDAEDGDEQWRRSLLIQPLAEK